MLDDAGSQVVIAGNHAFVEFPHHVVRSISLETGEVVTAEDNPNIEPGLYYGGLWVDGDWVYWVRESEEGDLCPVWLMRAQGGGVAEAVEPMNSAPTWHYDAAVFDGYYHHAGFRMRRAPLP